MALPLKLVSIVNLKNFGIKKHTLNKKALKTISHNKKAYIEYSYHAPSDQNYQPTINQVLLNCSKLNNSQFSS
jgi:hypothetical protein